jgi:hypothetical protein
MKKKIYIYILKNNNKRKLKKKNFLMGWCRPLGSVLSVKNTSAVD